MVSDGALGCECGKGYHDDGTGVCVDIDECTDGTHECQPDATCVNSDGGYDCDCSAHAAIGYEQDGFGGCACRYGYAVGSVSGVCEDIDECTTETDNCVDPAVCENIDQSFNCKCPEGTGLVSDNMGGCMCPYGFDLGDDGICADIDECTDGTNNCVSPAVCTNVDGGFSCDCPAGTGMVTDNNGGCVCPDGYELDVGGTCVDLDECTNGTNVCVAPASCTNAAGGYSCDCPAGSGMVTDGNGGCVCPDGYQADDDNICEDIDECTDGSAGCDLPATCNNFDGGFTCDCPAGSGYNPDGNGGCMCPGGFTDTGSGCEDIDECTLATDNCVDPATCSNFPGGFSCDCPAGSGYFANGNGGCMCPNGYSDTGSGCVDVDECSEGSDSCHESSTCVNQIGSYYCNCQSGYYYTDDYTGCLDIDECGWGWADCGDQTCVNTDGGYYCE